MAAGDDRHGTTGPRPCRLRPAALADVPILADLELELFPDEAWTPFQLAAEIEHPARRYVVAETTGGDRIIGYAGIMIAGDLADLHTVGTTCPGQGVGRALLAWCEQQAHAGGATALLLEVREDNVRARAVYSRAGYAEIGRRRGYYRLAGRSVDAIVMRREL